MPATHGEGDLIKEGVWYLTSLQCSKGASQMSLDEIKPVLSFMYPSLQPVIMLQGTITIPPKLLQDSD